MTNVFDKDPDAILDYRFDWSEWLETGDTIASYDIDTPAGIVLDSSTNTTTSVTAWLSGGTDGAGYKVTCHIVTADGREDDRSIYLRCRSR